MPTISQLPPATEVTAADQLPISQGGSACAISVGALLEGTQPAIMTPSGMLLGRTSLGPGGPDAITVGTGLQLNIGTLVANGGDHAGFSAQSTLSVTDQAVLNSSGIAKLMPLSLLRGLFSAGSNVTIDQNGTISAASAGGAYPETSDYSVAALPVVSSISASDLIAISQAGTDHSISFGNLLNGETVDGLQSAGAVSDQDDVLVSQSGGVLLRQTFAAIWTWLSSKLSSYLIPTLEVAANTALATTSHNGRILICSQPVTITAASSDLGSGFGCTIINASSGIVTFGANVVCSSGASTLPPGQAATLSCVTYSGGTLVYALTSSPATTATLPAPVTGLSITATTASSVALSWTSLTPTPASYAVQYRVTGSGTWASAPSVSTSTCTVTGLLSAASYDFVVSAVNGAGSGAPSAIVSATTSAGLSLPGQVTAVAASNATSNSLTLSWSAPSSGGAVASYTVQYRVTGNIPWSTAVSGSAATTFIVTALSAATSYDFQVFAVNATGSGSASSTLTTSTTASTNSVTAVTWNMAPSSSYTHGGGVIPVNAHITPASAPVQFGFSTSATTPPASWTLGNYVNTDLWGAYVNTPTVAGIYYAWVEGVDGSLPTVYTNSFTVT